MGFRSLTWLRWCLLGGLSLGCLLLLGCSRTGLYSSLAVDGTGGAPGQDIDDPSEDPTDHPNDPGDPAKPNDPTPQALLPEITIASTVDSGDRIPDGEFTSLVLVAPLVEERGPFELTRKQVSDSQFSPHGQRFAFIDEAGLYAVDSWPPRSTQLDTAEAPRDVAWVDDERLVVTTRTMLELHDVVQGTTETLYEVPESTTPDDLPPLYIARPSPDGRWLAFAKYTPGGHQVWLMKLDDPSHELKLIYELPPGGGVVAWFDWAPDSEHLAFTVTAPNKIWLRPYSVATKDGVVGYVGPISFSLGDDESVVTFSFSPDGKSLHYLYEVVDVVKGQVQFGLFLVDMSGAVAGPSVLLSSFNEPNQATQGYWSPNSDMVAFSADFYGNTFRADAFIAKTQSGSPKPIKVHAGEFEDVLEEEWSADGVALYFTAMNADQVARVYKSNLAGSAVQLSQGSADVNGLYVSSQPGCFAYSQLLPKAALTIVKESTKSYFEIGQPEWNSPDWTTDFDSSYAQWVSDSSGLRGLLYRTDSQALGDTLAWASVEDCVPSKPEVLIEGNYHQTLGLPIVSTIDPWPWQK